MEHDKAHCLRGLLLDADGRPTTSAFVHFVPSRRSVVPSYLRERATVTFQVGYDMPVPIPDLTVNDVGVMGTLSFHGNPFHCMVVWDDVWALTCPTRNLKFNFDVEWPESVGGPSARFLDERQKVQEPRKGHLTLIRGGKL